MDNTTGNTITWSVITAPAHGTLGGFAATATTNSSTIFPSGTTYQPAAGFNGSDAFVIAASDGTNSAQITVSVSVGAAPAMPVFTRYSIAVNQGQMGVIYSLVADPYGTSYNWIYLGSGVTINSNNSNSMTMDFGNSATSGTLYVQITGPCGNSPYLPLNITVFSGPLPVTLTGFTAQQKGTAALLQWTTATEVNSRYFAVEKSADGKNFTAVKQIPAAGNSHALLQYQYTDSTTQSGKWWYRLKEVDADGKTSFTSVRVLLIQGTDRGLTVYPNPGKGTAVTVDADGLPSGAYKVQVYNSDGKLAMQQAVTYDGKTPLVLNLSKLPKGSYFLTLSGAGLLKSALYLQQ